MATASDLPDGWPFHPHGWDLDGMYPPPRTQVQSHADLVHARGWTVLAMWDRSGDRRPNSNSAFIARGELTFDEMTAMAAEHFPGEWKRINDAAPVIWMQTGGPRPKRRRTP
jgi:hypothetical protein